MIKKKSENSPDIFLQISQWESFKAKKMPDYQPLLRLPKQFVFLFLRAAKENVKNNIKEKFTCWSMY